MFSFFITDKTTMVVNNMDDIMVQIKSNKESFSSEPIDAIIIKDEIIPGISGKKVNINKSYKNMRKKGYYSDDFFIFDYITPKISINNNKDKFITKSNPQKKLVSLVFTIDNNDNVDDIITILENFNVKATFFATENWISNNKKKIKKLINNEYTVAPFFNDYTDPNYEWIDIYIKNISKKDYSFCYFFEDKKRNTDACKSKNNYSIKPIEISEKTPLVDIKTLLQTGSIFSLSISSQVKKELSTIIIFIKSKGLDMSSLDESIIE